MPVTQSFQFFLNFTQCHTAPSSSSTHASMIQYSTLNLRLSCLHACIAHIATVHPWMERRRCSTAASATLRVVECKSDCFFGFTEQCRRFRSSISMRLWILTEVELHYWLLLLCDMQYSPAKSRDMQTRRDTILKICAYLLGNISVMWVYEHVWVCVFR